MSYKVIIEKEDKYIRFDLYDKLTQSEIESAMEEVLIIRQEHMLNHILCDQRQLQIPPNDLAGFMTALQFGSRPYRGTKLAIIRRDLKEERLFDIAAHNLGVTIKIFEDEEKAKRWLFG